MELEYPWVLYIGIPIIIILLFIKLRKGSKYKDGKKVANTKYVKEIPYYKRVIKKYKFFSYCIKFVCIVCIILSLVLLSRPIIIDTYDEPKYSRDIFLCMDVSTSVDELNKEVIDNYKNIIKSLKNERFGIVIFNTSPVLLVPLTDDYEYIIEVLDNLSKAFDARSNLDSSGDDYLYLMRYISSGTIVGNEERGSSLIGDGLASCVYNFSNLEEDKEKARSIILSTDNDLQGTPTVTLEEAAKISKSNNITVFGIAPEKIDEEDKAEFKEAVEITGGEFFTETSSGTVSSIVNSIDQKAKSLVKGQKQSRKIDKPEVPFIVLIVSLFVLFMLDKKVKL